MEDYLVVYTRILYQNVPLIVYELLILLLCLGTVLLLAIYGYKKGGLFSLVLLLAEYVFLLFCSTVFFRNYNVNIGHDFCPFWSYEKIWNGQDFLIVEHIMNVVVFVPIGILLGIVTLQKKKEKGGWKIGLALTLGVGLCISVLIEALQYFFKRGFSELDDVFHNTLGCLIGFIIAAMIKGIWLLQKKYLMN